MPSASVTIKEVDLTAVTPSFPGLYIGMVLPNAVKGPVNKALLNTTPKQFLKRYTPDDVVTTGYDIAYFSALTVLSKSDKLWTVRPSTTGMLCAGATFNTFGTPNTSLSNGAGSLDPDSVSMTTELFKLWASSPGNFGNNLKIAIWNYKTSETTVGETTTSTLSTTQNWGAGYPVKLSSSGTLPAPLVAGTTYYTTQTTGGAIKLATSAANANSNTTITLTDIGTGTHTIAPVLVYTKQPNTFCIQVFKSTNLASPVESFIVSRDRNAKLSDGTAAYIEEVLKASNYIYATDNITVSGAYANEQITPIALNGGADGSAVTDSDCVRALAEFNNPDEVPVTLLIDAGRNTVTYQKAMISLCETRRDCFSLLSIPYSVENSVDYLGAIDTYVNNQLNVNSSFGAIYTSNVLVNDKFNDRQIYMTPDAHVAALFSAAQVNYDIWYPIAGYKRGMLNVLDVKNRYTKAEMDFLVDRSINAIRFAPGKGIAVWSQRTLLKQETATSRINVRIALIVLEPLLQRALEEYLHDLNDDDTRAIARITVDGIFKSFKAKKGIASYDLVFTKRADETNPYEMTVNGYIVPMYGIEQIPVTVTLTNGSVTITAG